MNVVPIPLVILALSYSLFLTGCSTSQAEDQPEHEAERQKIVVTSPVAQDVVTTQEYVAQIHSRRHIEVRALDTGYLEKVQVQEGQTVKKGDLMFKILPVLYQAKMESELAHAEAKQINYDNTKLLSNKSIVSNQELALAKAELAKAQAQVKLAQAELNFTTVRAPFDGIVDRQRQQLGSLVEEGDVLSTLSDNSVMWVYFNVPEARYLDYKTHQDQDLKIELKLANGQIFPQAGVIGAIEADFNNETGNIAFRADFPNPDLLLRHGQTGTVLLHRTSHGAIVIPQRATFEILAKKYVFVIEPATKQGAPHESPNVAEKGHEPAAEQGAKHGAESGKQVGVVRQREIAIQDEKDDIYVIKDGLGVNDKIVFEGIRQVRDGDEIEYDFEPAEKILGNLKYHAE